MKSAWEKDNGINYDMSSAMAKLKASKVAMEVTVEAVQVHGGNGFVKEYHVERMMRDAKIKHIYEGPSDVQKIVISRGVLRDEFYFGNIKYKKNPNLLVGVFY
jgi:alkylation response protein AidB-like acyl-CoA dehydrogenase